MQAKVKIKVNIPKVKQGKDIRLTADGGDSKITQSNSYLWTLEKSYGKEHSKAGASSKTPDLSFAIEDTASPITVLHTYDLEPGEYQVSVERTDGKGEAPATANAAITIGEASPEEAIRLAGLDAGRRATRAVEGAREAAFQAVETLKSGVSVSSNKRSPTVDQPLWVAIRNCVDSRDFEAFAAFIDRVLCKGDFSDVKDCGEIRRKQSQDRSCYKIGVHGYDLLKAATEVFLLCHSCGDFEIEGINPLEETIRLGHPAEESVLKAQLEEYLKSSVSPNTLPYLKQIIENLNLQDANPEAFYPFCDDSIRDTPCLFELIWSYWHEEGMLVQALNAINLRFQNRRVGSGRLDPLANLEIAPLHPLNNLLWGYVQDSEHQLSIKRRAYEYDHHYGLKLTGKSVGQLVPADPRSKFLEAFHNLLQQCAQFYKDDSNQWITPDTFPLLNAIRAVHLLLAEGAHNQFGDLPSTARAEMLVQQWLLAQPPMREFLHSRAMVPYEEPWMGQVDALKKMMGWTDVSIIHFHKLAVFGEKILLSIRYGDWNDINATADQAGNWAIYWRPEVQGYIEAYRSATGVQLAANVQRLGKVDATLPSVHLQRRLAKQAK